MGFYLYSTEIGAHYRLTSADGITASFNNPFAPDYVGMLTEVSGLDSPEIRESAEDLVESDGGSHGQFYYGRRPITMNGRVFGHASIPERAARLARLRLASEALRADATLSWAPSNRVENAVVNPRFGTDLSAWSYVTTAGATVAQTRVTGQVAPEGTTTAQEVNFVSTGTSQASANHPTLTPVVDANGATRYPAAEVESTEQNVAVSAAYQIVSNTGASSVSTRLYVRAYNAAGTLLGNTQVGSTKAAGVTSGWFTMSGSIPVSSLPVGTARVTPYIYVLNNTVGGATIVYRITNAMISVRYDTSVPGYLDGGSIGGYWWGTPGSGPSGDYVPMQIKVRRNQPFRESGGWTKDFQLQLAAADPLMLSPYVKILTVPLGSSVAGENQGNGHYYPEVLLYAGFKGGSVVSTDDGGAFTSVNGDASGVSATPEVKVDTLTHDYWSNSSAPGVLPLVWTGPFNHNFDWATQLKWPSSHLGNTTWTFTQGPMGTGVGGKLEVLLRDAWI